MIDNRNDTEETRELPDLFPWTLEVSLSGGGFRAAAFALGALLYLAHCGLNTRVKNISSVSGGSVTNAFVACHMNYGDSVDFATFCKRTRPLASAIAYYGLFQSWQTWAWLALLSVFTLAFLASAFVIAVAFASSWLSALHWRQSPALISISVFSVGAFLAIAVILPWLLHKRAWVIDKWMERIVPNAICMDDFGASTVDHVFCATDLKFGQPFFFSTGNGGRLFSTIYGLTTTSNIPVLRAVRASAAYPPLVPPVSLKVTTEWVFEQGFKLKKDATPVQLWLTDGGPYNNFGTEWNHLRNELETVHLEANSNSPDRLLTPPSRYQRNYGQVQIVVDASQILAGRKMEILRIPILRFFSYALRAVDVMYGSTLVGRSKDVALAVRRRMQNYPAKWLAHAKDDKRVRYYLKDHAESYNSANDYESVEVGVLPIHVELSTGLEFIAQNFHGPLLANVSKTQFDWKPHNAAAAKKFGIYWPWTGEGFIRPKSDDVKTGFWKLGREQTLKLIIEGYLKTRETLFWTFQYSGPSLPELREFENLLGES